MQLRKDVYFLGTCIVSSEKSWVLRQVVGKVASKVKTVIYFTLLHIERPCRLYSCHDIVITVQDHSARKA